MITKSFIANLSWLAHVVCLMIILAANSQAINLEILKPGQQLKDVDSLISPNKIYTLSFFIPDSSQQLIRYLGIEFMKSSSNVKYVWIANRDSYYTGLSDSSGTLNLTQDGNLILSSAEGSNLTINTVTPDSNSSNITVTLSNSGSLVLKAGEKIVWQSFEKPADTLLPGIQVGIFGLKMKNPVKRNLTSWLSSSRAYRGAFTLGVDPDNLKQLVIWQRDEIYWSSGNWEYGSGFRNLPSELLFNYTSNQNDNYFTFLGIRPGLRNVASSCVQLTLLGDLDVNMAVSESVFETPRTLSLCKGDYTGCVEKYHCKRGDEFISHKTDIDIAEWQYTANNRIGLADCKEMCKRNCSCLAYTSGQFDGTSCKIFFGNKTSHLFKTETDTQEIGVTIYVRSTLLKGGIPKKMQLGFGIGGSGAVLISCICGYFVWRKCFAKSDTADQVYERESKLSTKKKNEGPLISFPSIQAATKNFDRDNFLGQGGFGQVYKGTQEDGSEIAVKRLSQKSRQGVKEFANEVLLISKLQHRNLVQLLGCCIHEEERILIYEYLPNNSLDAFLFDETKRQVLDWKMRFSIIEGIAQGILYLHKHSPLKIIHRDLKASNVLLDANMNPKISDFGTARIVGDNEFEANTKRIVGTYGYMPPEYAMNGIFSEKSDIFSYGVMLLEIISSRKNIGFYHLNCFTTLLGYAWELWKEGQGLDLVDSELKDTYPSNEALRCVQIGLLCVQATAADRPIMSDVVSMLSDESITLPAPKQPGFCNVSGIQQHVNIQEDPKISTKNQLTISDLEPR